MSRRTKVEMETLRNAIYVLAEHNRPCTVRQLYYLGIGRWWDKDTGGSRKTYKTVVRLVGDMREAGELPWGWIADNTRWVRQDNMYASANDALERWAEAYRRDLWAAQPTHVEVWCESDSIAGVLDTRTRPLGVGLYVCRGQSSKTYVYEAVQAYQYLAKPVVVLYVGDWDPSGLAIPGSVEERMARYSGDELDLTLERIAVTPADVLTGELISHEANTRDSNYRRFVDHCALVGLDPYTAVEVEAVPPGQLRDRLSAAILDHVDDPDAWRATEAAEESEREILRRIAEGDVSTWATGL